MTGPQPAPGGDDARAMEEELAALRTENARLRALLGMDRSEDPPSGPWRPTLFAEEKPTAKRRPVDHSASREEKVALFRSLFVGRADVYAARWANERTGKAGWSPQVEGGWANARRADKRYLPVTEDVVRGHLAGGSHIGLYPLMDGDTCRLLACDFDGAGWLLDALAFHDSARAAGIPAALERSRSGDGGHVWVFFAHAVPASSARRIGMHLLREAMTVRAEIDLASYDRLFPAQDFVPKGSFGNLIALPLQGECRKHGNTVFLDRSTLEPYADQWAYLASIEAVSVETVAALADGMGDLTAGPDTSFRRAKHNSASAPPKTVPARAGAMLTIDRVGLPPDMVSALKHLASLHNPDFYEKERLRLSTWNTPRCRPARGGTHRGTDPAHGRSGSAVPVRAARY